jgi:L-alanine-DL-glutamate epimerase-like enolase superfamily enzyme
MDEIEDVRANAYRIPLDQPHSDGTIAWTDITVVVVLVSAADRTGLGWTYGPAAAAQVVAAILAPVVREHTAADIHAANLRMRRATRNAPTPGLAMLAISAVDVALWDLKAKLLNVPLSTLLGRHRSRIPLYGSGGYVSLTDEQLTEQLGEWVVAAGMNAVKIKVGENRGGNIDRDLHRIAVARKAIGPDVDLMIDANGGYGVKQAIRVAGQAQDVVWFEEPVSSDRLADLALLRGVLGADVAAGEYGTTLDYFRTMCAAGAVDCLQIDATRCGGYTGALAAAAVADSFGLSVSTHCGPHLHAPLCGAIGNLRHAEWFGDHVWADAALFDGLAEPERGALAIVDSAPGHGYTLRDSV